MTIKALKLAISARQLTPEKQVHYRIQLLKKLLLIASKQVSPRVKSLILRTLKEDEKW